MTEKTLPDRERGLATIRAAVAESLALDLDQVAPTSRLVDDLGADSLDFIDLIFTLEKEFDVKLREGEFDFVAKLDFTDPAVLVDGHLTRPVVERLRENLPALDDEPDLDRISPQRVFGLITIETLWIIVERKLQEPAG